MIGLFMLFMIATSEYKLLPFCIKGQNNLSDNIQDRFSSCPHSIIDLFQ